MKDYVVLLDHDIYVYVTAELFVFRDRSHRFQGLVSFYSESREVASFLVKDLVAIEILHSDDSLEKVFSNE